MSKIDRLFKCLECLDGFRFKDTNAISCIRNCSDFCLKCSNVALCQECQQGYHLDINKNCIKNNCIANTSLTGCSICNINGSCIACSDPTTLFNTSTNKCEYSCPLPNCFRCLHNNSRCLQCQQGYVIYEWTQKCIFSVIQNCKLIHDWKNN